MSEDEGPQDKGKKKSESPKLGPRDYIALAIAALETFLLPLIVLAVVLGLFALIFVLRP
jgi:hypothetical protein